MGQLIVLSDVKADRSRPSRGPAAFFFALGCPISYLAAELVERTLGHIEWVPLPAPLLVTVSAAERRRREEERLTLAERHAAALRLPLVPPENPSADARPATRAAAYAGDQGAGAPFALAVARLAFCGGFDLADRELIAEAGAAAGLEVDATLQAAGDNRYDVSLQATARGLMHRGVRGTPAVRIGTHWFEGLDAVPGASSFTATRARYGAPLSPAG